MADILVVGSANIDLVVTADHLPKPGETILGTGFAVHPGGKGANQAVAAARGGGKVSIIAKIGTDEFGASLRGNLAREGVALDHLQPAEGPSGTALIITAVAQTNMIVVVPGANALLDEGAVDELAFKGARVVLAQLETPLDSVMRAAQCARENGAIFILDPAPARPLPAALLSLVDWLTPNEGEARHLLGLDEGDFDPAWAARRLQALGPRGVIIKLGANGIMLLAPGEDAQALPGHKVAAIDTTAAGDAFNGAFAVALNEGRTPRDAALFAIKASAISVTRQGAQSAMPSRDEIEAFCEGELR